MSSLRKQKGSLLLEALLSIVILSTSITLIIRAMTSSLRALSYSKEYTDAVFLAENEIFESISQGFVSDDAIGEKVLSENNKDYHYSLETSPFYDKEQLGDDDETASILEVVSTVSWKTKRRNNKISLTTLLFEASE